MVREFRRETETWWRSGKERLIGPRETERDIEIETCIWRAKTRERWRGYDESQEMIVKIRERDRR